MKQLIIRILRLLRIYRDPEPRSTDTSAPTAETKTTIKNTEQDMETTPNHAGKTLHALLIAIDNYPILHHRLNGCVNDRNAFKEFLERRFDQEEVHLNIKILSDQEATKQGIIEGFKHFDNAKDGDICVFYYSGHGSRANSPREFWHLDPDRKNESVVCYDSRISGGKDLMDKEMSYLFWKASWNDLESRFKDLHFTAIFDCCHSGTISRSVVKEEGITERMAEPSPTPNRLQDYFGFESYTKNVVDNRVEVSPPSGKFIQLAASKDDETAKELRINNVTRGIFTYNLIEILEQTNSLLTYSDLESIMRVRVANRVSKQTPQLISPNQELRNNFFLGGHFKPLTPHFNLNFIEDKAKINEFWAIDGGLIHGIPAEGGVLELEDGKKIEIERVEANRSIIKFNPDLVKGNTYRAYAKAINFSSYKVAIDNTKNTLDEATIALINQTFEDQNPIYLTLESDPLNADYLIKGYKDSLILTLPASKAPLFKRVNPINENTIKAFLEQADTVAKWKNLLNLKNGRSSIQDNEIEINLYRVSEAGNTEDSAAADSLDWRKSNLFSYQFKDGEWHQPSFRLSIRNKGQRKLYVSALNLQSDFKISNRFLPYGEMVPGAEASWLIDLFENTPYKTIPLELPDANLTWGITEIKEYIKFIISTDPALNTDQYEQDALEQDVNEDFQTKRAGRGKSRTPSGHDWVTKEVEMVISRPLESYQLSSGRPTHLLQDQLTIVVPEGVSGSASLTSVKEAERAISGKFNEVDPVAEERSVFGGKQKKQTMSSSSYDAWGNEQESELFAFGNQEGTSDLGVLELKDLAGADSVNQDNPIKLQLSEKLADHEFIVPMGIDPETGLFYPLGSTNEDGEILIENLPAEETATRSVGRSLKLFFHKVVFEPLGIKSNWPRLARVEFEEGNGEDGLPNVEFEYVTDQDDIKAKVAEANNIVLFIHGIIGNTELHVQSLRKMKNEDGTPFFPSYDLVLAFDYENLVTEIQDTAKKFKEKLAAIGLDENHTKNLTIVAHSMGGLVSRWMIEKEGGNTIVSKLIMCGTPNNGSPWSNVKEMATVLLTYVLNGATFLKPYTFPLMILKRLGKKLFVTLEQMHPEKSDFLKKLNDGTDPGIPYSILMGDTLLGGTKDTSKEEKMMAKVAAKFVDFVYESLHDFLFKSANDIAVSEGSATTFKNEENWSNDVDKEIVGCDHMSYFTDEIALEKLKTRMK